MINFTNITAALVLGVALASASPASAAQRIHHPGHAARAGVARVTRRAEVRMFRGVRTCHMHISARSRVNRRPARWNGLRFTV